MKKSLLFNLILMFLTNCYLNPTFRGIVFPEKADDNLGILLLVAGGLASGSSSGDSGDSNLLGENSEDNNSVPTRPIGSTAPSITFSPNSFSFKRNFAIPAIRPVVEGTPFSDCVSSDPLVNGLLLQESNCRITGTPTSLTAGPVNYTITATNSSGNGSDAVSIEIVPAFGSDESSGFTVTVSGLQAGESFIFDDILGNEILVSMNGNVTYDHPHLVGSQFQFTILENPTGKNCTIENSSGTVSLSNPPIDISCE